MSRHGPRPGYAAGRHPDCVAFDVGQRPVVHRLQSLPHLAGLGTDGDITGGERAPSGGRPGQAPSGLFGRSRAGGEGFYPHVLPRSSFVSQPASLRVPVSMQSFPSREACYGGHGLGHDQTGLLSREAEGGRSWMVARLGVGGPCAGRPTPSLPSHPSRFPLFHRSSAHVRLSARTPAGRPRARASRARIAGAAARETSRARVAAHPRRPRREGSLPSLGGPPGRKPARSERAPVHTVAAVHRPEREPSTLSPDL